MGKLEQAAKSYEKAERIFKRIGATRMQAFACANLGTNLLTRGFLGQARERILQARRMFEKIGDNHSLAYTIGDLGFLYFSLGEYDSAEKYLIEALDKAKSLKDDEFILESEMRLVWLNQIRGQIDANRISGFLENARAIGSTELEIKANIAEGMIVLQQADYKRASEIIDAIKEVKELSDFPELAIELFRLEIILANNTKQNDSAMRSLNSALKKSLSGDLAMAAIDLITIAEAFALQDKLPPELVKKIKLIFNRIKDDIDSDEFTVFMAMHRRKIENLRNLFNHPADVVRNNRPVDV
jgi:tetratricopeptide (TPR) repeat protein